MKASCRCMAHPRVCRAHARRGRPHIPTWAARHPDAGLRLSWILRQHNIRRVAYRSRSRANPYPSSLSLLTCKIVGTILGPR